VKPFTDDEKVFTIGYPMRAPKALISGTIPHADAHAPLTDLVVGDGGAGGPVFLADGSLAGLTSMVDDPDGRRREQTRIVPLSDLCEVVTAAAPRVAEAPPAGVHLPIEPSRPFPADSLEAGQRGIGNRSEYMAASSDFDIALITPVLLHAAEQQQTRSGRPEARVGARVVSPAPASDRALMDFANWSEYVAPIPPVLLVRVTPRLVDGFWTRVARGAALTQGAYIPSVRHFQSGFSRLQAFCGDREVTPVHPLVIEHQVSDSGTVDEGLYVFEPDALGPQCGNVRFVLYSAKAPDKGETRVIDRRLVERIWQDFAPWRAAGQPPAGSSSPSSSPPAKQ
jgi:hypothetical protein